MIILFSSTQDPSTYDIQKWLEYLGYPKVLRINAKDEYINNPIRFYFDGHTFRFNAEGGSYTFDDIKAVWYRKGKEWMADQFYEIRVEDHPRLEGYLNRRIKAEQTKLAEYIEYVITTSKSVLGNPFHHNPNKLIILELARQAGFRVPQSCLTNDREAALQKLQRGEQCITKSLSDGIYFFEKREKHLGYFTYTEEVTAELIEELAERPAPFLMQHTIDKDFEVRSFFLEGDIYSMAIFSQNDEQTRVDFRKYNGEKPNRKVPYQLPAQEEEKLRKLMKKMELNTGSADLLVDRQGEFYFLEVNPVGQFGMVSSPCNYQLEKKVATSLINHANGFTKA